MNIQLAFPSKYLRPVDLGGRAPTVAIDRVVLEPVVGHDKPVCYFRGKRKGLLLNRTNARTIARLVGSPETDQWRGRTIRLIVELVPFDGERVEAIRIRPAAATPRPPALTSEPTTTRTGELTSDDIRF